MEEKEKTNSQKKKNDKKPAARKSDKLFDYLDNILVTKSMEKWEQDTAEPDFNKQFPVFMVLRFLSMNSNADVRNVVIESHYWLNKLAKTNPEGVYLYLMKRTPRLFSSRTVFLK